MSLFGKVGGFLHRGVSSLQGFLSPGGASVGGAFGPAASFLTPGKVGLAVGGAAALLGALRKHGGAKGLIPGAVGPVGAMARGPGRPHLGRFSGQPIPRGTKERFSKTGAIILTESRRGHGLTTRDLRGFRRTIGLLRSVGMVPKRLHVRHHRARVKHA